jgi:hypothetical protein
MSTGQLDIVQRAFCFLAGKTEEASAFAAQANKKFFISTENFIRKKAESIGRRPGDSAFLFIRVHLLLFS